MIALIAAPALGAPPPPPNAFNDRLRALDSLHQRSVLRRAIIDDGNACGRVTAAAWRGPHANLQRWEAECSPGGSYAIFVGTDASVQVRDCPSLKALKLPLCRLQPSAR